MGEKLLPMECLKWMVGRAGWKDTAETASHVGTGEVISGAGGLQPRRKGGPYALGQGAI